MLVETISGITGDADLAAGASIYPVERARAIVQMFARVTTSQDADAFAQGFTEDCVVHFPPDRVLEGRGPLRVQMRGDQIARWDATTAVWTAGHEPCAN